MKTVQTKREREKRMVTEMIKLYCKKQHHTKGGALCPECDELNEYAKLRSDKCPFMETKTFCSNCKVHCYKPVMREKIRAVMRFSGCRCQALSSGTVCQDGIHLYGARDGN